MIAPSTPHEREMTDLLRTRYPEAFARRIALALAVLAGIAALQSALAVWAVGLAGHHVSRGRVAADIKLGFTELWLEKQRFRSWLTERNLSVGAADERSRTHLHDIRGAIDRLDTLTRRAVALDPDPAARAVQAARHDDLVVLRASVERIERGVAALVPPSPGLDAAAWRQVDALFDNADGRDLRSLLSIALAREDALIEEKRVDTDETLAWLTRLWIGFAAAFMLAALTFAVAFARALRAPLRALTQGAAALREGVLSHRIAVAGPGEFAEVARSMNAMAAELAAHRIRETQARQALEDTVARRTAELTATLEAQNEAEVRRRRLFADISHELRTPTTAIRGEAQITLRGGDKQVVEYRESLLRIEDAARQLGATIDDLLTMARSDIDALSLRRAPIALASVLDEVVSLGSAMARAQDVHLAFEPCAEPLGVLGDADRLRQMFLALIDNAIRYSRPGGAVRIAARAIAGDMPTAEVTIRDSGIGIDDGELPKVFERGYRAPNARFHRSDGSGLGLPIARILARGHGGGIELTSDSGTGTLATVRLPLVRPPFEGTA